MKDSDQFIESILNAGAFEPLYLNQPHAWVGHMPFASWLIKEISPEIFVEIGSHIGNSYFSFVQSAHENRLSCKCYAVDTWKGNKLADQNDETVFQTVNQHNSQHYQAISQLLRMTFNEALSYFDDQSIGLLHIDGLHTYEAVRHDFESWLPKMKPGGVVVFHDTNVREKKIGVWRRWNELKEQFPNHAEFLHSQGLGVIQIGSSGVRLKWLEPESKLKQWMLKHFTILGQRLMERADLQQANIDGHGQFTVSNQAVSDRDEQLATLNQAVAERDGQLAMLNQAVAELDDQLATLHAAVESAKAWQKRSWAKKAFHKWQPTTCRWEKVPLFKKLERSFHKRKNMLLGWHPSNIKKRNHITPQKVLDHEVNNIIYNKKICCSDDLKKLARQTALEHINQMTCPPTISVVMPTFNTKAEWLCEAIDSVRNQIYPNWQLCIADDASTNPQVREIIEQYCVADTRIRAVNRDTSGHISAASNSALELATGEFVALLDHDDLLSEYALYHVASSIQKNPDAMILYSDEDKIAEDGSHTEPHFKSDWNPDLLFSQNYICHLCVIKHSLMQKIGGFRTGVEGSQDHDLLLRCLPHVKDSQIIHIPKILYHWRIHPQSTARSATGKSYTTDAGIRALRDYFNENGPHGTFVEQGLLPNTYRLRWPLTNPEPLVSLLIPTRDRRELVETAITSIIKKSDYKNFEIIVIDNGSTDPDTLKYFTHIQKKDSRVRVIGYDYPFNYSAINNYGISKTKGDIVGFINNDIEVISPCWLAEMVSHALRPQVGCVGAKLYYSNESLQHAGVILGIGGVAGHSHKYFPKNHPGYFARTMLTQNLSAVTAACLIMRKSVFEEVGGFDEKNLKVAFNDIDLCLKVREAGYRNLWTPYAELYHHESLSRGHEDSPEKQERFQYEVRYMQQKWNDKLIRDPYYNENLTLDHENFTLK